ncbi:Calmodulin-binding_protein [Hexamita inflata]|uniref:Calmodulin-binding protein n=1 Tax=Hexamita inflata TaxID=28002 RepID=A0AA86QE82_9EUKA|nr:Calmodulin-binding protein [Hexamita inflata]
MNESISNLVAMDEYQEHRAYQQMNHTPEKKTFYKSIYADKVRAEDQSFKDRTNGHSTMGLAPGVSKPSPHAWVKKNQFHPDLPDPQEYHYSQQIARKPPIPNQHTEIPVYGLKSNVDFVQQNIKKVQLMMPKVQQKKDIDWMQKDDFGKVPQYLSKVKETIQIEQSQLREIEAQKKQQREKAYKMDENEKIELLAGLKKNWQELHSEYVGTTKAVVDTLGQKERKQWLERRMAEIEADIVMLEKGDIFVK